MAATDFPFYDGRPALVTGGRWWVVMLGLAAGYAALTAVPVPGILGVWVRAVLFAAIPLAVFVVVVPRHLREILRPLRRGDLGWIVLFTVLCVLVLVILGVLLAQVAGFSPNPLGTALREMSALDRLLIFLGLVPQLFGEELLGLLPFLALLHWLHHGRHLSRPTAVVLASLGTVLIFGPTYDWNVVQCFVVVGSARVVLLLAYVTTKTVWVPTGAHVLTDWTLFGLTLSA